MWLIFKYSILHINIKERILFMNDVVLSFGSNISGKYEHPVDVLSYFVKELGRIEVDVIKISSIYRSLAVGASYQPPFYNLIVLANTGLFPNNLLQQLKMLERDAGRRGALYWGPRPLDIDIIDYNQSVSNWQGKGPSFISRSQNRDVENKNKKKPVKSYGSKKFSNLSYPHLLMHERAFVLKPLEEVCPMWRHPVFGLQIKGLMNRFCLPAQLKGTEKLELSLKV